MWKGSLNDYYCYLNLLCHLFAGEEQEGEAVAAAAVEVVTVVAVGAGVRQLEEQTTELWSQVLSIFLSF